MKKLTFSLFMAVVFLSASLPAQAKTKRTVASTAQAPAFQADASETHIGLGFATYGGSSIGLGASPAVSVWVDLNTQMSLQGLFAVNSTNPFTFGLGGVFRYNLHGNQTNGFHGGLGFNLGTSQSVATPGTTAFFLNIFPVAGYHFSLGGAVSNLQVSIDGGPVFACTPAFQFTIQPLSTLVGGSVHYFF